LIPEAHFFSSEELAAIHKQKLTDTILKKKINCLNKHSKFYK